MDLFISEVAYLGRYLHWTLTELLTLDHAQRDAGREVTALLEAEASARALR